MVDKCFYCSMQVFLTDIGQETQAPVIDTYYRCAFVAYKRYRIEQGTVATQADHAVNGIIQVVVRIESGIFRLDINGRIELVKKILVENGFNTMQGQFIKQQGYILVLVIFDTAAVNCYSHC